MSGLSVLFVDDEPEIRKTFRNRFANQFPVTLAEDGEQALELLKQHQGVNVVVTDIRMPKMSGLELLRHSRSTDPDLGFIVVSGHGDSEEIVQAFRLGARNFLRKPYRFAELEHAILEEAHRYELVRQQRAAEAEEKATDQYLVGINSLTYELPTALDWINPLSVRLVQLLQTVGICDESTRFNVVVGLVEILTNAVEHGNLGITGTEKMALKVKGEQAYQEELRRRIANSPYRERVVRVQVSIDRAAATVTVSDEGQGFDFRNLPDPTDPDNLFKTSGRGILLAQNFLDEVIYSGCGNAVTMVKYGRNKVS